MTNLTNLCDKMTGLADERRAVDTVYLDFSKVFDTDFPKILIDKLLMQWLDEQTVTWIENWLKGWAQRVVTCGAKSVGRSVHNSVP